MVERTGKGEVWMRPMQLWGERRPIYDPAFNWLLQHCPDPFTPPVLIYGDFRMGNLLINQPTYHSLAEAQRR